MFTLPDWGEGDSNLQSILFQEYLDVLLAGINGVDCVLSGCAVTGGADMTPACAKGAVLSNRVMFPVTAADFPALATADATNPRLDLLVINNAGAKAVRTGTPAAYTPGTSAPKPPARSANDVVVGVALVMPGDTSIETSKITPLDVNRSGPISIIIHKVTTPRAVNNTAAAISLWATPPVIPNGLFLAGKFLEVEAGGNMLVNSGTPTVRLEILYGGTTMYSFISVASVADADRCAWYLKFKLVAQGDADQSLVGHFQLSDLVAARPTPTTGIGSWQTNTATAEGPCSFSGAAAVNSDAGDSTLDARITISVANAANEFVVEYATVKLLG